MPKIGNKAPDFSLKDQNGNNIKLSDFKGKKIILYFYPKDNTPGCTLEACNLRDNFEEFKKRNAVIVGISKDNENKHRNFIKKYNLPFTLLVDDQKVCEKYNSYGKKKFMGIEFVGILRKTFIIDEHGCIKHIIEEIKTKTHGEDILKLL